MLILKKVLIQNNDMYEMDNISFFVFPMIVLVLAFRNNNRFRGQPPSFLFVHCALYMLACHEDCHNLSAEEKQMFQCTGI